MLIVSMSEIDYTAVGTPVATLSSNLTELVTGMYLYCIGEMHLAIY